MSIIHAAMKPLHPAPRATPGIVLAASFHRARGDATDRGMRG